MQEKIDEVFNLVEQVNDAKKEIEILLFCDRECCQKKAGRVYKKNEITSANISENMTLSGTAQFNNYAESTPILDIAKAMRGNCDRVIMNKKVYETLNSHPEFIGSFEELKKIGNPVKKDVVSTIIIPEISIQDIENTIIIEKDGEPVYAMFQVIP